MRVSIIIPAREINDHIRETIPHILNLDYKDFEILIFPNNESEETFERTKIISTGNIVPGKKRDLALKYAKGEIFAFLDDDAYPKKDWLNNALFHFKDPEISAVCGPSITPFNNTIKQKAGGWVSASLLGGGIIANYRFLPKKTRQVDDYASVNFIIRKIDFQEIGGFGSDFWPGEDTQLCLNIVKNLKKKIIYDPNILVYHHRRPLFISHLKQNGSYGLHRGHFARILPETSKRLSYFIPCLFVLGLIGAPILYYLISMITNYQSPIADMLFYIYIFTLVLYGFLLFTTSLWVYLKERNLKIALLVIPGIFLTHIWYGIKFIQGFFSKNLKRQSY